MSEHREKIEQEDIFLTQKRFIKRSVETSTIGKVLTYILYIRQQGKIGMSTKNAIKQWVEETVTGAVIISHNTTGVKRDWASPLLLAKTFQNPQILILSHEGTGR
ncbi:hypothetical protein [Arcticibacter svalbardensis]|uniref:hypothetical protein n=1 Tax=Arcticibacter svalbardensis TaxID=1288027 RepID=UPI00058DE5AC|nr:hypothetical protein [Arcticibacter svalbardensis]